MGFNAGIIVLALRHAGSHSEDYKFQKAGASRQETGSGVKQNLINYELAIEILGMWVTEQPETLNPGTYNPKTLNPEP